VGDFVGVCVEDAEEAKRADKEGGTAVTSEPVKKRGKEIDVDRCVSGGNVKF